MADCFSSLVKVKWIIFAICSLLLNLLSKPDRNRGYPRRVRSNYSLGKPLKLLFLLLLAIFTSKKLGFCSWLHFCGKCFQSRALIFDLLKQKYSPGAKRENSVGYLWTFIQFTPKCDPNRR